MTVTAEEPLVEIFGEDRQHCLVGISGGDFHAYYGDFAWLLVRESDSVVVAGCRTADRQALADQFEAQMGSLAGYAFSHGPRTLGKAYDGLYSSDVQSQRSKSQFPSR